MRDKHKKLSMQSTLFTLLFFVLLPADVKEMILDFSDPAALVTGGVFFAFVWYLTYEVLEHNLVLRLSRLTFSLIVAIAETIAIPFRRMRR